MRPLVKLLAFIRPYWRRAALALILLSTLVLFDLAIPRLVQRIIDQGINAHNQQVVIQTSLVMLALSVVGALIAIGNNQFSIQVGEGVARDVREAIFLKIHSLSYGDLDRRGTGELMVRLTSDTNAFKQLVQITLRIGTRAPMLMLGSLILMFRTSPSLAASLLPLLAVTLLAIVSFIGKTEPMFRTVQRRLDRLNTVLQENVAGVRLVRSFARAEFEEGRFEDANEAYTLNSARVMRLMAVMGPTLTMLVNIGMVIVIYAGGRQAIAGTMTEGQIVAFVNYLLTTMTPLIMMTMLSNVWASGMASATRIDDVLATHPQVADAPDAVAAPPDLQGRIVFQDVSFRYREDGGEPVLRDVNLVVDPGETVAILGATGSGKLTLVNLVPRFYDATAGRVLIDGVDVRRLRQEDLLAHIGIVPQEALLFSGTVADNIRYGDPRAGDEAVTAAAGAAQAAEFVEARPEGYAAPVEPRGANFSGGQKQRLTIARALLPDPRILILDDSTSSVDVETETRIQEALEAQPHHRTTLVVAQRISTVLNADKIVVLD
ncbi:MAG TPA: ABC transporter ATP-binding protein, partial [Anaerolineales bacterium]|nr:ABC transporter ATP-binding protein [Anaerolineales bacterium]